MDEQSRGLPWQVQLLRITSFASGFHGAKATEWWETVVGEPPESKSEKPKELSLSFEGPAEAGWLTLNITLDRVDWLLGATSNLEEALKEVPNIGDFDNLRRLFGRYAERWLTVSPPTLRLAFGAVLVQPVPNRIAGYQALQRYLQHMKIDPDDSSELLYQVNRARESKVLPGLRVNRLQKWSVAIFQRLNMAIVQGQTGGPQINLGEPMSACRLELDINSAADRKEPIPADRIMDLYREFVTLAQEITIEGDIR